MKKKKGAVLIWVLIVFMVLIITGTAILFLVSSSSKIDSDNNVTSTLRIETYTGLNLGKYYLINENGYNEVQGNIEKELNVSNLKSIANDLDAESLSESIQKYNLEVGLKRISDTKFEIKSTATFNGNSYTQSNIVTVPNKGEDKDTSVNNFLSNVAGIAILGKDTSVKNLEFKSLNSVYNNATWLSQVTALGININGIKDVSDVSNWVNSHSDVSLSTQACYKVDNGGNPSQGLNLLFKEGNLKTTANTLIEREQNLQSNEAYLINGNNYSQPIPINQITAENIESSNGILANIGPWGAGQYVLINNGNIVIEGNRGNTNTIRNSLIYATNHIRFDGLYGNIENVGYDELQQRLLNTFGLIKEAFDETGDYSEYLPRLERHLNRYNELPHSGGWYNPYYISMTMLSSTFTLQYSDLVANKGIAFFNAQVNSAWQFSIPVGSNTPLNSNKDLVNLLKMIIK